MRRLIVASASSVLLASALLMACWNWDALSRSGAADAAARYCAMLDGAVFCDDFDDTTVNPGWTSVDEFAQKYATLDDAAFISAPQSLLVSFASTTGGATYYEAQIQPATARYDISFWFRLEALSGDKTMSFFGIECDLPQEDDAGQYQLWISGGPDGTSTTATEKLGATTLAPQSLADAGLDFPLGEWKRVSLTIDVVKGTLTVRTSSEDAAASSGTLTLMMSNNFEIASRAHMRLGVFAASANTSLRARYDDFAVGNGASF